MAVIKQKATSCDLCTDLAEPSCVYACPHDAAHRVEPNEFFRWVGTPLAEPNRRRREAQPMRIDRTHRPWVIATVALAIVSTVAYILYAVETPGGPRGGSALGLTFGIVGYAMMLYAGLLGARKQVPTWRLGRAQTWMRGHLWLGLLSLLLILFHGGFAFRGPLTLVLMLLFFIVIGSGILGAAIQHYVPSFMTARVPLETIYEEIPHVRAQLREEADQLAIAICGPLDGAPSRDGATSRTVPDRAGRDRARRPRAVPRRLPPQGPALFCRPGNIRRRTGRSRCVRAKHLKLCAGCSGRPCTACWTIWKTSAKKSSS